MRVGGPIRPHSGVLAHSSAAQGAKHVFTWLSQANLMPDIRPPERQIRWKVRQVQENEGPTAIALQQPLSKAISARLKGPGGYYNLGNLLGLVAGTAVQMIQASANTQMSLSLSAHATFEQFVGSPSAVALSVAMLVFFWSGEIYHRAWSNGFPPDAALNRRGDVLSGVGALFLGIGLLITGQPMLAATAGLLHAIGKFGSAWSGSPSAKIWPPTWPDLWRSLVLASRLPALLAAILSLAFMAPGEGVNLAMITPVTLILCYLLWIKADLLLFGGKT